MGRTEPKSKTQPKARRKKSDRTPPRWMGWMQWLLAELCIVAALGTVLFAVFQSLEKKRQSYLITELVNKKVQIEEELNRKKNEVEKLSSLERIAELIEEERPELAPAERPALVRQNPEQAAP